MPSPGAYKTNQEEEKKPLLAGYSNVKTDPYQLLSIYSDY